MSHGLICVYSLNNQNWYLAKSLISFNWPDFKSQAFLLLLNFVKKDFYW